jgi:dihydrofolate synthase/folylpolyglutamate synthase
VADGAFHSTVNSLGRAGMHFGLARMRRVMSAFDHPENAFQSIHVAGTNGKGSVSAMLASVLRESERRVGLYTSPHLERYNERFQINGQPISDRDLDRLTLRLIRRASLPTLTQFEFLTALAFLYFSEKKVDVAVVETGLGGRLDATNVLDRKVVSIITNIDLDHTEWLGSTREQIAFEKAGIINPTVPVVTGASGGALTVIRRVAHLRRAPLTVVPIPKGRRPPGGIVPVLAGRHQWHNQAIALATLDALREMLSVSLKNIRRGLRTVKWPGRLEQFRVRGIPVLLDGAHNPAATLTLVNGLKAAKIRRATFLFGALRDKDVARMIKQLQPFVGRAVTVAVGSSRTRSAEELALRPEWKGKAVPADNVASALARALSLAKGGTLVVTGSLYLVGEVRAILREHT